MLSQTHLLHTRPLHHRRARAALQANAASGGVRTSTGGFVGDGAAMNPNAQDFCPRATTAPRTTPTVPIDGVSRSTWRQRRQSERDSERNGEAAGEVCRFFRMGRCKHGTDCRFSHHSAKSIKLQPLY